MKRLTLAIAAITALGVPATLAAAQATTLGSGDRTCVLKAGADCRGVVHPDADRRIGELCRTFCFARHFCITGSYRCGLWRRIGRSFGTGEFFAADYSPLLFIVASRRTT